MAIAVKEKEEIQTEVPGKITGKTQPVEFPSFPGFGRDLSAFYFNPPQYVDAMKRYNSTVFELFHMWNDYSVRLWDTWMDQSMSAQKEGRALLGVWMDNYQKFFNEYQKMGEKNLDLFSSVFKK